MKHQAREARTRSRNKAAAVAGLIGIMAVAVWLWLPRGAEVDLERVARDSLAAAVSRNATELLQLMSPEEVKALKLDSARLGAFLNFWSTKLSGFKPDGGVEVMAFPESYAVHGVQRFAHEDGRRTSLAFQVHGTDDHPIVLPVINGLLLSAMMADFPADKARPSGRERARFMATYLGDHARELEATGLSGTMVNFEPGQLRYQTWEQYRRWCADHTRPRGE